MDPDSETLTRRFKVKRTQGDGNCLFHALHALMIDPTIPKDTLTETPQYNSMGLRERLYEYMELHYKPFAKLLEGEIPRYDGETDKAFVKRYVDSMKPQMLSDGTFFVEYAGTIEIQAFAMMFNAIVYVISIDDPKQVEEPNRRFAHIYSRHFPCSSDGTTLTADEADNLTTVAVVFDLVKKHYSSVHVRRSDASTSTDKMDPAMAEPPQMTVAERAKFLRERKKKNQKRSTTNEELREAAMERNAREKARNVKITQLEGNTCNRDPSNGLSPEDALLIQELILEELQAKEDHKSAIRLSQTNP
tara:strand:- start:782 stop:1693 length:912 start_codon:yes stop_codon:yes gene_type:complete